MHLLIPFASTLSDACAHTVRDLKLPNLSRLLGLLTASVRDIGDEIQLSPPHERAIGSALGWTAPDGLLPWGAHHAAADGVAVGSDVWALLTPVHMHVGTDQVTLLDPAALQLDVESSRTFLSALRDLFETADWRIQWGGPLRWYAAHPSLADLPTASIDRAIGRNVDPWLKKTIGSRPVRGLQNEVQMLLYELKLNDERIKRGQLPINSFWVSGCGPHRPALPAAGLTVDESLRFAALAEEWSDWADAWRALDAGPISGLLARARAGEPVQLTLCGERHAQRYESTPLSFWQRIRRRLIAVDPAPLLESL